MAEGALEADYVVVGAGAVGMAFADTLLTDSAATLLIVDRRATPGGHWNEAYPFVRLHGPSANYGVNSRTLGSRCLDRTGLNEGLYDLAGAAEILAYFDQVMRQRMLPSGRVTYLPLSAYADGVVTSLVTGARTPVRACKKTVDATFADTRLPVNEPPPFPVAEGARCVPPNALARLAEPYEGYVVIGAGKTAMDTVVWLLEQGVDPRLVTWIRPRDAWLLNRRNVQPSFEFFAHTIGTFTVEMEAARDAASLADLFARLEAAGVLLRIDRAVTPAMYRCATVSEAELAQLRRVENVVRLGHVTALEPRRIVLERGEIPTSPRHLHIHCAADGIPRKAAQPIFQGERIVLQYVRRCSPTFSGAFVAHLEATLADEAQKNALCTPIPVPDKPVDWLSNLLADAQNRFLWSKSPEIEKWLLGARLDGFAAMVERAVKEPTPGTADILGRYAKAVKPGTAQLARLLADAACATATA